MQFAPQAAMKAYYWSDLSGYVISDKSMSQRTKNLSKRMNIDTYSFTDLRFHFFHRFRLSSIPPFCFFKANIYFQRWETEIPSFLFCFVIEKLWIKIVWTIGWRSNFISGNSNEDPSSFRIYPSLVFVDEIQMDQDWNSFISIIVKSDWKCKNDLKHVDL